MSNREDSAVTQRAGVTAARLAIARLGQESGVERMLRAACEISAWSLNVDRVGVWLFDESKERLTCRLLHGGAQSAPIEATSAPAYFAEIRKSRFLVTYEPRVDPRTCELGPYLEQHGITAMLDAPVYREGVVVGVVCHERIAPGRPFSDSELHFAATVADMTAYFLELGARLEAQEDRHAQTLSQLSAGVAHDVGNLLGVISAGIETLAKTPDRTEPLELMREAVDRGRDLSRALVGFTRSGAVAPVRLDAEAVTRSLVRACAGVVYAPWSVTFDVDERIELWVEPVPFEQVVANLAGNARDAMPGGGAVLIRVRPLEHGARLEVIDSGQGMSPEVQAKLFTPFFTTKAAGAGTGLGLATVRFIAQRHGGSVVVDSAPGDGTTLSVLFPKRA